MGGHIEILQLNHPDSATFPAMLFDWLGDEPDPYVPIDDVEGFFNAVDRFEKVIDRHGAGGNPSWDLWCDVESVAVTAHANRFLRFRADDPFEYESVRDAVATACRDD